MAEEPEVRNDTPDEYEYDLAHEVTTGWPAKPSRPLLQLPPDMHVAGNSGDYGHDLAHDMG